MPRAFVVLAFMTVAGLAASPAQADTPAPSCAGVTVKADTFATPGVAAGSWLENMGFDGSGGMWVSELFANKLVRFDSTGTPGRALNVASPGASIATSPTRMFALFGDGVSGVLSPGGAGAVTFDPSAATPAATPFFSGISMANGGAVDRAGNLYITNTFENGVIKIRPDGTQDTAFRAAAPIPSGDGAAIHGNTLYVTELNTPDSPIDAIPLDNPSAYRTVARLSPGGPSKLLDDLDVGPDGKLYVASNYGQVFQVDPTTGAACTIYSVAAPLNSVRFARGFAPYGANDFFTTSEAGAITHVRLNVIAVSAYRHGRKVGFRVTSSEPCKSGVRIARGLTDSRGRRTVRLHRHHPKTFTATKAGCVSARVPV